MTARPWILGPAPTKPAAPAKPLSFRAAMAALDAAKPQPPAEPRRPFRIENEAERLKALAGRSYTTRALDAFHPKD